VKTWIKFCAEAEVQSLNEWLKRHHLSHEIQPAKGRGEIKKHARLSDELLLKNGGAPDACALCGARGTPCRQWLEGDDTDFRRLPKPRAIFSLRPVAYKHACSHTRGSMRRRMTASKIPSDTLQMHSKMCGMHSLNHALIARHPFLTQREFPARKKSDFSFAEFLSPDEGPLTHLLTRLKVGKSIAISGSVSDP